MITRFHTDAELDDFLSTPSEALTEFVRDLPGDLMILGVAGKMGITLAIKAKRASIAAGVNRRVIGVARFTDPATSAALLAAGVEVLPCDLVEREPIRKLPRVENVIYMVGRKFGTEGQETLTWAANVLAPANVAEHFYSSRIVAFSTGCVYPLVTPSSGGCMERNPPQPLGEYAQSCLGRERIFEYYANVRGTRVCLLRLNYAIDLRYGVLHDIARRIVSGEAVDLSMPYFNCIWQGDATSQAMLALDACQSPMNILNVTGPEIVATREVAERLAKALGRPVEFTGEPGETSLLSNASEAWRRFGPATVTLDQMIDWTADWLLHGGRSLNLPTHFEVLDGSY